MRPPLRGVGGLCSHLDEYALPLREPAVALPPAAVYVLAIVAPVVLVRPPHTLAALRAHPNPKLELGLQPAGSALP